MDTYVKKNYTKQLLKKFCLSLGFLLLTQWLFWFVDSDFFMVEGFGAYAGIIVGSIVYAIATTAIFLMPYAILMLIPTNFRIKKWYRFIANFFYIIGTLVSVMVNIIDIVYYRFTFRRMTSDIFDYLGVGGDFKELIPAFAKDFWPYVVLFVVIIVFLFIFNKRISAIPKKLKERRDYIRAALGSCGILAILILFICGGLLWKPINIESSTQYASVNNMALVVNTPFSIVKTFGKKQLQPVSYFNSEEELDNIFSPINIPDTNCCKILLPDSCKKSNVVIIVLESFSAEYMGCLNGGKESYTPFLDSLAKESLVFDGFSNGKRSIEAIPSVFAGIPSLMNDGFIASYYKNDKIKALPIILKDYGYYSAFFHGAYNGSMGFDVFAEKAGFCDYFGMNEFLEQSYATPNDRDNIWGIFDEPFLHFMAQKMNTFSQPFLTGIFTISSHHPYRLPEKYKGKFKKGMLPILEVVMYSDNALRLFFEEASKQNWYNNTLFIITGDHTAQGTSPANNNSFEAYKVPMIFYHPKNLQKGPAHKMMQQADVVPSVIDFLGIPAKSFAFGKSMFNPKNEPAHLSYSNGYYQLIRKSFLVKFNTKLVEVYDLEKDPLLKNNLIGKTENPIVHENENYLKAVIQQYNNRLISDRMFIDK